MIQLLRALAVAIALVSTMACAQDQAAPYQEGVDYQRISPAQPTDDPSRIEVVEVFSYSCPHCYSLESTIGPWAKALADDVRFVRVPAVFRADWEPLAQAYLTAEILGVNEQTHGALFDAIHTDHKHLDSQEALADFYAGHGVDKTLFNKTFTSFVVKTQLNRGKSQVKRYGVTGVPAIIIEGKYLVTGRMAKSYDNMLRIMDYLIDVERRSRAQNS